MRGLRPVIWARSPHPLPFSPWEKGVVTAYAIASALRM
jgi:hypothetical protein